MTGRRTGLQAVVTDGPASFAREGAAWLRRHPLEANVVAALLDGALTGRRQVSDDTLWVLVRDGSAVGGAAVHTPGYEVLLTPMSPDAAMLLAGLLADRRRPLDGVTGPRECTAAFASEWTRRTGASSHRAMAERVYALTHVIPPQGVPGRPLLAGEAHLDLCTTWSTAFAAEVFPHRAHVDPRPIMAARIRNSGLVLWEDAAEPVSMAGLLPPVSGVSRIGPVYTPPSRRRRGYAAAVTAAASRAALDRGADQCMLLADVANPTSNAIYQRLGYRPVADADRYFLSRPVTSGVQEAGSSLPWRGSSTPPPTMPPPWR